MPRRVRRRRLPLPRAGGRSSEKLLARPWFPLDPGLRAQPGRVFVSAAGATVWRPRGAGYAISHGTGLAAVGRPALEHRQLPLRTALVEAQNVQIAVIAFDLEVAIVWSIPLIDGFDDFDLARIEPKAHRHFDAEMAGAALDLYLHNCLLPRRAWAFSFFLRAPLPQAVLSGWLVHES